MINIPNPCSESWDKMTSVEGGRHCGSCDKVIMDYTSMSNEEIVAHMKTSGTACGHFRADQVTDGTTYGGWKFYSKWKTAVALLMIGSVFMVSCRRNVSGYRASSRSTMKKAHKQEKGRREMREQWLTDESK